ncbi:hypothetical protein ACLUWI_01880 [Limosilactobacillus mucosae]|jgi:hypothetical protein|uniref:hypothetical protein n=1 Tax=Limosilactobacillus mucosae TaxID=97478 RepID=UPI0024301840|nr:hypothetical protein [Limosilactobacillus mucosae]MCI1490538.1 hypothetical protein [Limosilactobacillus mucosae]MCI1525683.1 hypothetical protein [Limosilactobacillus mucosae]
MRKQAALAMIFGGMIIALLASILGQLAQGDKQLIKMSAGLIVLGAVIIFTGALLGLE